jgi:hypothetical protein
MGADGASKAEAKAAAADGSAAKSFTLVRLLSTRRALFARPLRCPPRRAR